ncbi:hypothetical protein CL659_00545 [bacterium]|nr:hypothetical protein [bacterium]|tara:strand:+ start:10388 stop:11500 length:1113 start_codon:yes stop_codon:yes gene_type:complete
MSSTEAGDVVAQAILQKYPKSNVFVKNFADGGEGTADVLLDYFDHEAHKVKTQGANGKDIDAYWYFLKKEKVALLEMASIVGISMIPKSELDPEALSTCGLAPVIIDILEKGIRKIWFTVGGTSTVDAGLGLLKGMGVSTREGTFPNSLLAVKKDIFFDFKNLDSMISDLKIHPAKGSCLFPDVFFDIIADVRAPLLGKRGAVLAFGKQKGATPKNIPILEQGMADFACMVEAKVEDSTFLQTKGLGAAGGIALGLALLFNVNIKNGADFVIDKMGLRDEMSNFDFVITGEGQFNSQTKQGKGPWSIASLAVSNSTPVLIISGLKIKERNKTKDFSFLEVSQTVPRNKKEAQLNLFQAMSGWLDDNEVKK